MRILTELVGGIVLLLIFAYGVRETVEFFSKRETTNVDVPDVKRDPTEVGPGDQKLN